MKKSLRITLIVLGCIAAFILLIFLFGSLFGGCVAKNYVNKHSEELIGRQANVEHVGVNLFTGRVSIKGLSVCEDDDSTQFAGFDTLDVAVSLLRLIGKTVYVRHFTLAGLDVNVIQDGTQFNFSSIIDHFPKDTAEVEEPKDTTPSDWVIKLHKIRLSDGRIGYADLQRQSRMGLKNLNLLVPDFSIGGKDRTDADLTVSLAEGGTLTANADMNSSTNDFNVTLNLDNVALDQAKAYVVDRAYIDEIQGRLSLSATAAGNLEHIMDMAIAAKLSVDDVDIIDNNKASVASLRSLKVDLGKMVLSQNLYDINSVTLNGLTAAYELFADSTNTFSRLLIPATAADENEETSEPQNTETSKPQTDEVQSPKPPLQLRLGHLALTDINFTYADHTLPTDFSFPVTDIRVEADNVTTAGNNNARIFAGLPHGGAAMVNWEGNISNWKLNQTLRLNIKNLRLTDLSPYMLAYFGMPFSEGVFSFTSYNTIRNSQLSGKNRIDIFKPTLGDRDNSVKAKLHLPVKAALYILKDKDDKVILDVPVAGNIDSPEFNYMKLVWKTLGNLIVKVATSPARLLGNLVDGDGEELFVDIDPAEHDFTSEQFYMIDQIADLAAKDESLILNFELITRPTTDAAVQSNHQRRNNILQHHLADLGLNKSQYNVTTAEPDLAADKEGYNVTITIKN